jgi:threonine/homoserine/homoserine lactone efflux protein
MEYLGPLTVLAGVIALGIMSPGPNFLVVSSTAMHQSRRAGLATGVGVAAASATWAVLTMAGLGLLIAHLPWLYDVIRVAGAVYLIWLGGKMIWKARAPLPTVATPGGSLLAHARKAFMVSMTSPKSLAFYGSIFAVMVPAHAPAWVYGVILVMTTAISAGWYCSVAWLLSGEVVRRSFLKAKPLMETVMGLFLVGLGARILAGR